MPVCEMKSDVWIIITIKLKQLSGLMFSISLQFYSPDIHPSKIALIVREKEVIEGSRFHLECHVYGARPAANISWHNFTKQFDNSDKNTRISSKAVRRLIVISKYECSTKS